MDYIGDCASVICYDSLVKHVSPTNRFEVSTPSKWPMQYITDNSEGMYSGDTTLLNRNGVIFTIGINEFAINSTLDSYFKSELARLKKDPEINIHSFGHSSINNMTSKWIILDEKYDAGYNKNLLIYYSNAKDTKKYLLHFTSSDYKTAFRTQICKVIPIIKSFKIRPCQPLA